MQSRNIILVVGAGAVENAWLPVIRAVNKSMNVDVDRDGANFLFARHIYLLKFYSVVAKSGLYPEVYKITKSNVTLIKQHIINELRGAQASGEIRVRENFKAILKKFVTPTLTDKAWLVSTNWDEVVDIEINKLYRSNNPSKSKVESFHIHGSINAIDQLYLPTEINAENYRSWEDQLKIADSHRLLMDMLQDGHRTVLYGISLDPLDAELNQTLAAGWRSTNNKEIIIVNPDHEKVAKRVRLLLEKSFSVKVVGYHPDNLDEEFHYY